VHGLYRLSPQQDDVFRAFVDLLSQFDQFDQGNIVDDALRDAREAALLDSYAGARLQ